MTIRTFWAALRRMFAPAPWRPVPAPPWRSLDEPLRASKPLTEGVDKPPPAARTTRPRSQPRPKSKPASKRGRITPCFIGLLLCASTAHAGQLAVLGGIGVNPDSGAVVEHLTIDASQEVGAWYLFARTGWNATQPHWTGGLRLAAAHALPGLELLPLTVAPGLVLGRGEDWTIHPALGFSLGLQDMPLLWCNYLLPDLRGSHQRGWSAGMEYAYRLSRDYSVRLPEVVDYGVKVDADVFFLQGVTTTSATVGPYVAW